ncbi:secreted protein with Por secretion system C-terminal sorting domain [Psychroflexus torquis ATCC 700755]|uniref:Secreted protein with Por secretion system C-terminal sorting domain n=1 Tax=Psychroflexus torquis (strain ATCC 700755 / CIP 106069 / ACAM 623) TaxID=313595 RepID=K4III7_PSYTT|nr:T9SS type A sorting domain-containing protein [Psychroflexus torquis]AFU70159.1 secreted protein with Por secretion system C-terminal sorting domain [Psychroflexus torquis ATCC 700755]
MLKKLLVSSILFFLAFPMLSQSIVSTDPENKKAILEEFTGVNCTFCPQGHAIANAIKENNPDNFFVINIHQGGFSTPGPGQPDFRTPFGDDIVNQSFSGAGFGYPSGTANRQNFPGREMTNPGTTALDRNVWTISANDVINQSSYVNLGVEASIDVTNNELTVHVEAYYTGDSPESVNKLNVALLQNKTTGPQVGGGVGDNYVHMHRLVHLLTGQWGVDVTTTTRGSFIDETFTYTIPADYNGISANIFDAEMEVVVFMTETRQNIISGNGAYATYTRLANSNDAIVKSVEEFDEQCAGSILPNFELQNVGSDNLTSVDIEYSINDNTPQVYTWTGNLSTLFTEKIELPEILYEPEATNQLVISLPNDDDNTNNEGSTSFSLAEVFLSNQLNLTIQLDEYPVETTWNITNSAGDAIFSGGPYSQGNGMVQQTLDLPENDCYSFIIRDAFGDGICCEYGNGSFTLETRSGELVIGGGNFGSQAKKVFSNYNTLSTASFDTFNFSVYPNPTNGIINLSANENFDYQVFNLQGKKIHQGQSNSLSKQINLLRFASGVYFIKVNINGVSKTQKIILK